MDAHIVLWTKSGELGWRNQKELSRGSLLSRGWNPIYCYILCQLTEHCVPTNVDSQKVSKGWKSSKDKNKWHGDLPPYATTTLISLQIWSFVTHQRRIIISIYHSTNVREDFSTTGVFSSKNRRASTKIKNIVDMMYDALTELNLKPCTGWWYLSTVQYIREYIYQSARGLYSHAHPNKIKSPTASCSLPFK